MKKILMTMVAAFAAVSMNAQYYVGGTLGFSSSSDKVNVPAGVSEQKSSTFRILPEIGMSLDETMGVGIQLGYTSTTDKTEYTATGTPSTEVTVSKLILRPYLRYQFFEVGKANIFVDGGIDFAMKSQKDYKAGMDLGLFVTPGISYKVADKWSIVAKLNNMFAFGYHKDPIADVAGAPDAPSRIDAGLSTGGFNVGDLTFGVYYNF